MRGVSAVGAALLAATGLAGCKSKSTYVHVQILPAAGGEPAAITDLQLDANLAGKTTTLHFSEPGKAPIHLPTDVTLEAKSGSGKLALTVTALDATGAQVDHASTSLTVASGSIAQATIQLLGGPQQTLTVNLSGFGQGSVSANPAGISCSSPTCSSAFDFGTVVHLTPTAAAGSRFTGWTGACTGTGACDVTMNAAATVGATFQHPHQVTVVLSGTGGGNASSQETPTPNINCSDSTGVAQSGSCVATYNSGDTIMFTATADAVSFFNGVMLTGTTSSCAASPCSIAISDGDVTINTSFVHNAAPVAITIAGNGSGNVTDADPNNSLTCSPNCIDYVYWGSASATLTAAPVGSSVSWGGACAGATGNTCTLTGPITASLNVTVTFTSTLCAASVAKVQTFSANIAGCAASNTYANRATVCAAGAHVCTAEEWVQNRNGAAPTHHYWTDDLLDYSFGNGSCGPNGCGPSNCFVSRGTTYTSSCGTTTPMRVCMVPVPPATTDPEGNACNWNSCGYNSVSPNEYFGGCLNNTTAGTLCCSGTHQYFVSNSGLDTQPGTSALPFKTITKGLSVAVSGDTVFVKMGTYNAGSGETFPLNVPAGVNLIGDESAKSATISGTVSPGAGSTVAGFNINTTSSFGVTASSASPIIRNNSISGASVGIYVNGGSGAVILLNSLTGNSHGLGYVGPSAGGGKIENNTVTGNTNNGIEFDVPGGDLGGGPASSVGNNVISCNSNSDLYASAAITINADNNKWDHTSSTTPTGPTVSTASATSGVDVFSATGATVTLNNAQLSPTPCGACPSAAAAAQLFDGAMVGCAGVVAFANRATLCLPGCHVCSATEWNTHRGAVSPGHNFWTNDLLGYNSSSPPVCFTTAGPNFCSSANQGPGGVCGVTQPDPEGNKCNNPGHALCPDTTSNQFIGGCNGVVGTTQSDRSGALCCCP